jgi:hypothetical protein
MIYFKELKINNPFFLTGPLVRQTQTISFVFNRDKESHIMKIYKRPNNFDYDYSQKIDKGLDAPFSTNTAIAISP